MMILGHEEHIHRQTFPLERFLGLLPLVKTDFPTSTWRTVSVAQILQWSLVRILMDFAECSNAFRNAEFGLAFTFMDLK